MRQIRFHVPFVTSPIPHCQENLWVSIGSEITITDGNKLIKPSQDGTYKLTIYNRVVTQPLHWLVAFTFIPLYEAETFAHTWTVGFKSRASGKLDQKSLYWIPPKGGTPCPEDPSFCVIPGYSRHGVSEDGRIYARLTRAITSLRKSNTKIDNPYILATCWSDLGKKEVVMPHRAIGLAMLEYPEPPDMMTIDHLNGIKADNRKENLEWVSYAENNIRAMNLGLRKSRIPVIVRDYVARRDNWYRSVSDAAIDIGINSGGVYRSAKLLDDKLLLGRYIVRLGGESNECLWPDPGVLPEKFRDSDHVFEMVVIGEGRKDCIGRNIETGQYFVCKNEYELAEVCNLKPREIRNLAWGSKSWPHRGWLVRRLSDADDIGREYSELELQMIRSGEQIRTPFLVSDLEKGHKTIHTSLVSACHAILNTEPQNIDFKSFSVMRIQEIVRNGKKYLFEIVRH